MIGSLESMSYQDQLKDIALFHLEGKILGGQDSAML